MKANKLEYWIQQVDRRNSRKIVKDSQVDMGNNQRVRRQICWVPGKEGWKLGKY